MGYPFFPDIPALPGVPAIPRFPTSVPQLASAAVSIAGNTLSAYGVSGAALYAGSVLGGPGVISGTRIVGQLTGVAGGPGSYAVNVAQTFAGDVSALFSPPSSASGQGLVSSDGPDVGSPSEGPQWGIFDTEGNPVVTADNVVTVEYREEYAISDYQVEKGAFESYDKVYIPFNARVRFSSGGSLQNREALLNSVSRIVGDLKFYDVVTPEAVYQDANIVHQGVSRAAKDGVGLVKVDVWLEEVRSGATQTFSTPAGASAAPPVQNAKSPSSVSKTNGGTVQAVTPTVAQSAAFLNFADITRPVPRFQ